MSHLALRILLLAACAAPVWAEATVHYGALEGSERPAVVEAARVYPAIPAYRQIGERGLTTDDAAYWVLMERAERAFKRAVAQAAREADHDVVVEKGGLDREAPDLTAAVLALIARQGTDERE